MSEDEETYCRLCAEPTPRQQLIGPEEEVAILSKIVTKLLWINIDITLTDLPNTICFSCFDLLERTWAFLTNTRIAHRKLSNVFLKDKAKTNDCNEKVPGKPVDENWETFQEPKPEIKVENIENSVVIEESESLDSSSFLVEKSEIKSEHETDDDFDPAVSFDHLSSSDSDIPLEVTAKKKQAKRKKVKEDDLQVLSTNTTWEEQPCRCAKCDAQCKNITSLQLHSLEIHNRCCLFKCVDCGKVFNSFKAFIRHMRLHNSALNYCCEHCNKILLIPSEVKQHRSKEHAGIFATKCRSCGSSFGSADELQKHKLVFGKRHRNSKIEKLDVDLKCKDCDKVFKSRSNLQQHKLVHTQRSRDFSCHVCGKMFFTKGTLGTHMLIHEDTKPFKCEFCPLAFRARGNLLSHISLHSGAKPFVCEQCGKSFRVKRHLKSHSIVHTDLMPFVCQYCNKSFRFKTRLNLHLRQHTGAKPYSCVYCQRDFTNGSNYKKHMRRRHNIDTSKQKYNSRMPNKEENLNNESVLLSKPV